MSTLSIRASSTSPAQSSSAAQTQASAGTASGLDFGALLTQQMVSGGNNQPVLPPGLSAAGSPMGGAGGNGAANGQGIGGAVSATQGADPAGSANGNITQAQGQTPNAAAEQSAGSREASQSAQKPVDGSSGSQRADSKEASQSAQKSVDGSSRTQRATAAGSSQQVGGKPASMNPPKQGSSANGQQAGTTSGTDTTLALQAPVTTTAPSVMPSASVAASTSTTNSASDKALTAAHGKPAAVPPATAASALQGNAAAMMGLVPLNPGNTPVAPATVNQGAQSAAQSLEQAHSQTVALPDGLGNSLGSTGLTLNPGAATTDPAFSNLMATAGSAAASLAAGLDPALVSTGASGGNASVSAPSGAQSPASMTGPDLTTQMTLQMQAQSQVLGRNLPVGNTPSSTYDITTPFGSSQWGQDLSQKITWLSTSSQQSAEMTLNPPDLGPLKVVLQVTGDQATALFSSAHAAVRDAVQQALPQLRSMMADNGITLGNATVSDQSFSRGQGGFSQGQSSSSSSRQGILEVSSVQGVSTAPTLSRTTQGLVDTFA